MKLYLPAYSDTRTSENPLPVRLAASVHADAILMRMVYVASVFKKFVVMKFNVVLWDPTYTPSVVRDATVAVGFKSMVSGEDNAVYVPVFS